MKPLSKGSNKIVYGHNVDLVFIDILSAEYKMCRDEGILMILKETGEISHISHIEITYI